MTDAVIKMTKEQADAFLRNHIRAHTASKGRPSYVHVGKQLALCLTENKPIEELDGTLLDGLPVFIDYDLDNSLVRANYGALPSDKIIKTT